MSLYCSACMYIEKTQPKGVVVFELQDSKKMTISKMTISKSAAACAVGTGCLRLGKGCGLCTHRAILTLGSGRQYYYTLPGGIPPPPPVDSSSGGAGLPPRARGAAKTTVLFSRPRQGVVVYILNGSECKQIDFSAYSRKPSNGSRDAPLKERSLYDRARLA